MKRGLMPAFTCAAEKSATTSTTKSTQKTCNAEFERKDVTQRNLEASPDERRVCSRLQDSELSSDSIRKKDASRRIRPSGGKDRHSKVNTAKGPRDRRVRLSVSTAIQFYDVQDRLGFDQPSKAVEWLMREAKTAIDELPQLPGLSLIHRSNITVSRSNTRQFSAHEATASPFLSSSASRGSGTLNAAGSIGGLETLVGISDAARSEDESVGVAGKAFPSEAQVHATGDLSKAIDSQGAGSTSARIELRTKARERARERAKQRFLAARNDRESIVLSPPDHYLENIAPMASPADEHIHKFHLHSLVEDDQTPSSFRHVLKNNVHTEQMQATSDPLSSYPAFVHETVVDRFHNKSQKLPNLLNQVPSRSWPLTITTDQCSPGSLYCSSRKRPFSPSFLDSNMAFCQDSSARLVSCNSNAVSQLAVFGVPISSFTGTIMPADRIPIISLDPSQSAFRPTTQLPASLEERAALYSDHPSIKRIARPQPSSFDSKTNHILLNSQAAGVSHLASSSAFEQYASNQFPGTTSYIRASSDFQHYHDHALFSAIDSETLQSHDLKLPERLRGLDDIEEQLKRYSQN